MKKNLALYQTEYIAQLVQRIEIIEKKECLLQIPITKNRISEMAMDVETVAHYGLNDVWDNYVFLINKVVFRMKKTIEELNEYLCELNDLPVLKDVCIAPNETCVRLSYECEDMIIAFHRLYDEAVVEEICHYLGTKYGQAFRKSLPKKDDIDGLYWRINLLRNRMAHSTGGAYVEDKVAKRFSDFSSRVNVVRVENGEAIMECDLIDIEKTPNVKKVIKEVIIEKKYGDNIARKGIFDILFPIKKPKGHGKKSPELLWPSFGRFDYNHGFISLSNQILDFINDQILVFLQAIIENGKIELKDIEHDKCVWRDNQMISLDEVYDFYNKEWLVK